MLVAFSVAPSGGDPSVGDAVAAAVRIVRDSGLPNETTSMFTTIEGEWDEVMDVVKRATEAVAAVAPRVSLVLKADIRPGHTDMLHTKVRRVEDALQVGRVEDALQVGRVEDALQVGRVEDALQVGRVEGALRSDEVAQ